MLLLQAIRSDLLARGFKFPFPTGITFIHIAPTSFPFPIPIPFPASLVTIYQSFRPHIALAGAVGILDSTQLFCCASMTPVFSLLIGCAYGHRQLCDQLDVPTRPHALKPSPRLTPAYSVLLPIGRYGTAAHARTVRTSTRSARCPSPHRYRLPPLLPLPLPPRPHPSRRTPARTPSACSTIRTPARRSRVRAPAFSSLYTSASLVPFTAHHFYVGSRLHSTSPRRSEPTSHNDAAPRTPPDPVSPASPPSPVRHTHADTAHTSLRSPPLLLPRPFRSYFIPHRPGPARRGQREEARRHATLP
ncbi:hypothetical protein C8J57DRAFT_1611589 [Mycena rebaudengoi]|nr:hypothetical protein C8J57DRAFT_1611589 [Mycena rebaudengoi]